MAARRPLQAATIGRPLRIALLEPAGRGGICHYTRGLAAALAPEHRVALFTARDYEFKDDDPTFEVERVFARWRTSPRALLQALRRFAPDIVHLQSGTHPALHAGLAHLARIATGAPIVVTAHNVSPKCASGLDRLACRALYRVANRIVVHGDALAAEMVERFPGTRDRVRVVPHGEYGFLARHATATATATATSIPEAPPTLLFFGYLHAEKGLPDLIEALPHVAHELPDLRVVIAGTPEMDVAPLRERARALGLETRLDWRLRYVPDEERAALFEAATAVVLPYRQASQSGVAFLAGAFERPLIATRVGALPELVEDGRTGLLVPPNDPAALAYGISRILRDPAGARRMGRAHAARCREHGSWPAIADRTAALYGELRTNATSKETSLVRCPDTATEVAEDELPSELPFITVLMPARNEQAAIASALESLLSQDYPRDRFEIVVMDGRSHDGTRAFVRALALRNPRVRLLDNPGRIVPTALNLGFLRARGSIVARADAHTRYAPDYLRAVARAFAETGADVVGGPMVAREGQMPFERAVGRALASRFGMGGAAFHFEERSGPAESVYLGAFRADALHRFGPFDEQLVRNQDDEWFARVRAQGARIQLDPRIRSTYRARASAKKLFRQYFEYGLFKPAALRKVPGSLRMRHLAPTALVLGILLPWLVLPWLIASWAVASGLLSGIALGAYALGVASVSARICGRANRQSEFLRQMQVFALMHAGYGLGFVAGSFRGMRRAPEGSRAEIARTYAEYAANARTRRRWSSSDPGQSAIVSERDAALLMKLKTRFTGRRDLRILDLGSGDRDLRSVLAAHGLDASVVAADLLPVRLAASGARARIATDARLLPFADRSFDAVVQCTLLSSLPAHAGRRLVAAEMVRVCRPGGLVLSYDARWPNPFNRNVRRLARGEHRDLFEGCDVEFEALTLVPPLARLAPALATRLAQADPPRALRPLRALRAFDLAAIQPRERVEVP